MKNYRKYQIRRLIAATVLLAVFMTFTVSVIIKGIDNELDRRDRIMEEHKVIWEVENE